MGTDIHGRLQRRWFGTNGRYEDQGPIPGDRNYRLFAALADVRNGFGFAAVPTHDPLTPIAQPRGLPADLGTMVGPDGEDHDVLSHNFVFFGEHSQSWLTLKELLEWDGWDKQLNETGVVDLEAYERMKAAGETQPESWFGGISGPNVFIADSPAAINANTTHVRINWARPLRNSCELFLDWLKVVERQHGWRLAKDPEAVRIVFGFDS